MSDFGVLVLRSRHGLILRRMRMTRFRRQPVGDASRRRGHEKRALTARSADFAHSPAAILPPSAGCTRVTLMRPSAQTTVKPSASTATISPSLPPMPFGSFAGSGFASKILQRLAVERRPGAGRGIAAADQTVDLPPRLAPVDLRVVGAAAAFIGRLALVLLDARRLAGLHEIDRFHHRLDAHREQAVEIDRAERVGGADRRLLLDQHVAGIETVVGPEDRQPGLLLALDDRPVDRARRRDRPAAATGDTGSSRGSGC